MITFPQVGDEMVSKFPQLKGLIKSSQVQIRREFSRFFFFFFLDNFKSRTPSRSPIFDPL